MASLLVFVDPARMRRLLPTRRRGEHWRVHAAQLADAAAHLHDGATLFVVTLDQGRAVLVASLESARRDSILGDAQICDADITYLLPRLGCASADELPAWANVPRVLARGDVDLLLTRPPLAEAFALPPPPPPLHVVAADPTAARLLAAIYEDPASDAARLVFADYLQERDDPRGELIALQLAREASGQPASERERDLVATCGASCVGPLAPYLRPNFVLRGGFLSACAVARPEMPIEIAGDVAWSTVEELHTMAVGQLASPSLFARRVGISGDGLARALACDRELPVETLVGYRPELGTAIDQDCLRFPLHAWDALTRVGPFVHLSALSVWRGSIDPGRVERLPGTPLGQRLHHLDVWFAATSVEDFQRWRDAFDATALHRLTVRWCVGQSYRAPACVAIERATGPHRLVVQLAAPLDAEHVDALAHAVVQLAGRIERVEVQDVGDPEHVVTRQQRALRALEPMFARVVPTVGPLLAP